MNQQRFTDIYSQLTFRRKEVLLKFLVGETDDEIAQFLVIAKSTVRKHIEEICQQFALDADKLPGEHRPKRENLIRLFAKYKPELLGQRNVKEILTGEETPCKNTDFVGREEAIADINNLVNDGAKVILIQAEGGIGKTTLANEWFKRKDLEYLELDVGTTPETIYPAEDWLRSILKNYFEENPDQNFRAMLDQLKHNLQTERVGVLIDNLEVALFNGEFIEPHESYIELLKVLAHSTVQSVTLITSREPLYEPGLTGLQTVQTYPLQGLTIETWQQYFDNRHVTTNKDALIEMRQAYGGNALAMDLLSNEIRKESQGNLEIYWQQNRDDLLRHRTLAKLVQRQFNKLRDDNSQAHELLCRFGFYPNRNIRAVPKVWLFCLLWDVPERRQRVIDALCDRSLVKVSDGGYYLHPMIRVEAVDRFLREESNPNQLVLIKSQIDTVLQSDEEVQYFLQWVYEKPVPRYGFKPKPAAVRAFYLARVLDFDFDFHRHDAFLLACYIAEPCSVDTCSVSKPCRVHKAMCDCSIYKALSDDYLGLRTQMYQLQLEKNLADSLNLLRFSVRNLRNEGKLSLMLANDMYWKLVDLLKDLKNQLPQEEDKLVEWWKLKGSDWTDKLKVAINEYLNLGYNLQFNDAQKELLKQYYDANQLLMEYLNSDSQVSPEIRSHIEDTLLLPITEIEKRTPQ